MSIVIEITTMSNTPPSDPVSLRVQTNLGKKKSDGKSEEGQGNISKVVNGNTGEVAGSAAGPFAGEMERRGEEKVSICLHGIWYGDS